MDTPHDALIEHLTAFSEQDSERLARSTALPFVHLLPNGDTVEYRHPEDVDLAALFARLQLDPARYGRTELDDARLLLDWDNLKAFLVQFTRYSPEGERIGQGDAIWVTVRDGDRWKVKLRIGGSVRRP